MDSYHKTQVWFDGYNLTEHFVVQNLVRPFSKKNIDLVTLPGRDGAVIGNTTYEPVEISMDLVILDESRGMRSEIMRDLALLFNTDEPKRLQFSDEGSEPGMFYLAVANGGDIQRFVGADRIEGVTFTCPEPAMYGDLITLNISSMMTETFFVEGNYPTRPTITCANAVRDSTTGLWGVRHTADIDTTRQIAADLKIPLPNDSATNLVIDCTKRTVRRGSVNTVPTIDSDWFIMSPGEHAISQNLGEGAVTVTYYERWL